MRFRFLIIYIMCALTATASPVDYFTCDFSGDLPEGSVTIDRDQQPLHFTMVQAGFDQGDSWRVFHNTRGNYVASPARHKKVSGQDILPADDWLILPAVSIMASDATLTWHATTLAESLENGCSYQVRVSTEGNTPEDFKDAPLASIDSETLNSWSTHTASLGKYAGQRIWIAFVHTSLNSEVLAVTDILAGGSPGLYHLTSAMPQQIYGDAPLTFKARLQAATDTPVTSLTAYCQVGNALLKKSFSGLSLTKDSAPLDITFDEPQPQQPGDTLAYSFRVEVPGNTLEQPAVEGTVQTFLYRTTRRIVAEEGTGMWCTYCPRGIVAMQQMHDKYPDTFIGIAIHYNDALGSVANVADYCASLGFPGFPSAHINRHITCEDPMPQDKQGGYTLMNGGLEDAFLKEQQEFAPADIDLTWAFLEGGRIGVHFSTRFAINRSAADYRITAVALEDDVTASDYYQDNFYSGADFSMGGFESLPQRIRPYTFQEVARAMLLPFKGVSAGIPSQIHAGQSYNYATTLSRPSGLNAQGKVRVVAMLIENATGRIVNAVSAGPSTQSEYEDVISGIEAPLNPPFWGTWSGEGVVLDLTGRRVTPAAKGIIISQGRKIIK